MTRRFTDLDPERIRTNLERVREQIGPGPEILAAIKYVDAAELPALAEAGVTLVGENRAQELAAKHDAHADLGLRWHFIGQLQSRKVAQILPHAELIHSVASDSAIRRLAQHGEPTTRVLLEVDVAGEEGKAGFAPDELPARLAQAREHVTVEGLMTMPPFTERGEDNRRHFARLAELAAAHGLRTLSMGTSQDYAVAAQEGATIVRVGTALYD